MPRLLVDANLDGHAELIARRLDSQTWRELRDALDVQLAHFETVALERTALDDEVWQFCQENGLYLLTANRNRESEHSLEATIRRDVTATSLPVFTLTDPESLLQSAAYLDEVVERLLEYLLDEANIRGAGRLFLP